VNHEQIIVIAFLGAASVSCCLIRNRYWVAPRGGGGVSRWRWRRRPELGGGGGAALIRRGGGGAESAQRQPTRFGPGAVSGQSVAAAAASHQGRRHHRLQGRRRRRNHWPRRHRRQSRRRHPVNRPRRPEATSRLRPAAPSSGRQRCWRQTRVVAGSRTGRLHGGKISRCSPLAHMAQSQGLARWRGRRPRRRRSGRHTRWRCQRPGTARLLAAAPVVAGRGTYYRSTTAIRGQGAYVRKIPSATMDASTGWLRRGIPALARHGWPQAAVWACLHLGAYSGYCGVTDDPSIMTMAKTSSTRTTVSTSTGEKAYRRGVRPAGPSLLRTGRDAKVAKGRRLHAARVFAMCRARRRHPTTLPASRQQARCLARHYYDAAPLDLPDLRLGEQGLARAAWTVGDRRPPRMSWHRNLTKE